MRQTLSSNMSKRINSSDISEVTESSQPLLGRKGCKLLLNNNIILMKAYKYHTKKKKRHKTPETIF